MTLSTRAVPSVSVPVLSSRTVRTAPSFSISPAPFTITPARAARETPEIRAIGAAKMSGHGVATTKTARARRASPETAQATPATAAVTTRNTSAYRSASRTKGGPLRLRVPDEADKGCVGALGCRPHGAELEGVGGVGRPAANGAAAAVGGRKRLAGERGLVDDRLAGRDDAVNRDHLAGAHDDDFARGDLVDRHLVDARAAAAVRDPGCTLDELGELAARTTARNLLERVVTREHERNHRAGQVLAEGDRAGHRDERDRIDAHVAAQQRAQHRPPQRDEHDDDGRRPE
jgi:hypothetical protein